MSEQHLHPKEKTAQQLQDEVVELHEYKNWPDPRNSWLMRGEEGPVSIMSLVATGPHPDTGERYELAGGMSPAWGQPNMSRITTHLGNVGLDELNLMKLSNLPQQRQDEIKAARREVAGLQVNRYLDILNGPDLANDVIILKPQTDHYTDRTVKVRSVNADDIPRNGDYIEDTRPATMMYSRDTERVIGVRPSDCPTLAFSAVDHGGQPIHGVVHAGRHELDAGFVSQSFASLRDGLNVDMSSVRVFIAAGGVDFGLSRPADPTKFHDPQFVSDWRGRLTDGHEIQEKGETKWRFTIDMIGRAIDDMAEQGIAPEQLFVDSTDTSDARTGYSSNKQASRGVQPPTRDLELVASQYRRKTLGIK